MSALVLGCYDEQALTRLFCEEGVIAEIRGKGFENPRIEVTADTAIPHVRMHAEKHGASHLLLDTCLTDAVIAPEFFLVRGFEVPRPISLAVIHWARVQDPTARFADDRPRLPLQEHPGLGILRRVFRVGARLANQLGKDGLANMPKFPHDALIFFRSLLFLFADPVEQGRLEALWRDLDYLGLANVSLAVAAGAACDERERPAHWQPGFQVYPLSAAASAYFHSDAYTRARSAARQAARYSVDLASAGEMLGAFDRSTRETEARQTVGAVS